MRAFAVLSSNCAGRQGLLAENGLSLYIRFDDTDIIFDTGAGSLFSDNAEFMNLPLHKAELAVISHAHPDHCGGIPVLSGIFSMVSMCCKVYHPEGIELAGLPALRSIPVMKKTEISDNIRLILTSSETETGPLQELSLIAGNTLFTGCGHAGLMKIVKTAKEYSMIDTIAGGFHNFNMSVNEMKQNAQATVEAGIKRMVLLHCSSMRSVRYFEDEGIDVRIGLVGNSFDI
mgnify:CR=1 FL=1